MISVSIYRSTLVKHEACANGLALYDAIAAMLPETAPPSEPRETPAVVADEHGVIQD